MQKFTNYLLFVGNQCGKAEEAITFYTSLFKDSHIIHIERYKKGNAYDEKPGNIELAKFTLNGQEFMAQDSRGKHHFTFTPALSIFVQCETEEELDNLYASLAKGGEVKVPLGTYETSTFGKSKYVWLDDKFGVSWQLNFTMRDNLSQ